ncbi:MAG TPA: holo-ACP synthase [Candidatus Hydrothermia bacterium]|nr:holo-ACP synthase [Candidatus Hydrothermae bacterium]MDD3649015.1 holo-ACP synthase [Candidatus Hydrothermia bacterium]MDD5572946.1 holo-ACP synthase [Candidatus Hydrothermia bacterium]HOK22954.1 holo-ACP synthase [Candidatus Hydrothermia bacterium]HOL23786.1 holo-ACP synthase [Candidatus Hydrothermia bacterium]
MVSCGVDIVSIKRFCFLMEKYGVRFLERVFAQEEIGICESRKNKVECFAGKFAAKEAVIKALDLKGIPLKDIQVLSSNGKPILKVKGDLLCSVSISVSHEREYAVAMCVYTEEEV